MNPTAADLMTESPRTVLPKDTLMAVIDVMTELNVRNVRHVPVVDEDENLVGLVSQRDLLHANAAVSDLPLNMQREIFRSRSVGEAMVTGIEAVTPDTSLLEVAEMMLENKFGVGIITEADFVRYVVDLLGE
jgi:CBS domain-containing protein